MNRLEGKTAVVTGGGTNGIGRAAAARMVTEGAHVFITGRPSTRSEPQAAAALAAGRARVNRARGDELAGRVR